MLRDALCPGQPGRVPSKRKRAPAPLHRGLVPEAPASTDDLGRNFGRMPVTSGVSIPGGCAREGLGGTEVSDCPLNGPVEDLLMPLAASGQLTRLLAKRANLSGHVPDLACIKEIRVDGVPYLARCGLPLSKSLQALDLSSNKITGADALPVQTYISLANNPPITFATGTLQSALKKNLQLDLSGAAITNMRDISRLFETGALQMTAQTTSTNATGGYSCHDVTSSSLKLSSHLFWPQGLCGCVAGYEGSGTNCSECANNTFNDGFNSSCRRCPANSTAGKGTSSIDGCRCDLGRTHEVHSGSRGSNHFILGQFHQSFGCLLLLGPLNHKVLKAYRQHKPPAACAG